MKKVLLLYVSLFVLGQIAFAHYNHSIITSSGQTLYFMVYSDFYHNGYALVTYPGAWEYPYFAPSGSGHNYNYTRPIGDIVIPDSVTLLGYNYPVTGIESRAFYGCSEITSITIPEGVATIGNQAFCGDSLASITIPSSVDSIGENAFSGCTITAVNYSGTINQWCNIDFSNGYSNPVFDCTILNINGSPVNNLLIPDNVEIIKQFAFWGYIGLTSVTISNGVTSISIGSAAFGSCWNLTSVTIGSGVTHIGQGAFAYCSDIMEVTCFANVPPNVEDTFAFYWVNRNIPLYVPSSSVSSYQSAPVWSEFTNYIGIGPHTITATSADPAMGTVTGGGTYNGGATATLTATPNSGYHFVQWQDGNTQNPRTITVTGDATYTATFAPDAAPATVTATISQIAATSAYAEIVMGQQTSYFYLIYAPQSVFTQNGLTTDEAIISYINQHYGSSDRNYSNVSGYMNDLTPSTTYMLVVVPYNSNDEVGTITRKQFTTLNNNGIEDVGEEEYAISSQDGRLTVSGAEGNMVNVYSLDGRCIYSASAKGTTVIDIPASGTYLLKIGHHPARKVVVIR
ncbi:MAG: leucine-rich repeat domain-containing protein [Bacteroidales bacterium]|nr:leucine-rich repeat domain-containing protein [Bacteroidales bacterium]